MLKHLISKNWRNKMTQQGPFGGGMNDLTDEQKRRAKQAQAAQKKMQEKLMKLQLIMQCLDTNANILDAIAGNFSQSQSKKLKENIFDEIETLFSKFRTIRIDILNDFLT